MSVQVFREDRALVLSQLADPVLVDKFRQLVPSAFAISETDVGMPFTLTETQQLCHLGVAVPSPIEHYYDWPRSQFHIPQPFNHQIETAAFLTNHPRAYCLNDIGCVDGSTEYLSPVGWQRIDMYRGGRVGQYHLDGRVEFVAPTSYVKKPCAEMIRFKTKYGVDQLLSPDHTVLYVASAGGRMTVPAHVIEGTHHDSACGWPGRFITTFEPMLDGEMGLTNAQLRVMVAVIADSHFPNKTSRCVVRVKKQRKKDRLKALLAAAGIVYKERDPEYESAPGFTVFSFDAPLRAKEFDSRFWNCSLAQLHVVASELEHWDGTQRKPASAGFSTMVRASADFAQYAYAATGRTASLNVAIREGYNDEYVVHARNKAALLYLKGSTKLGEKCENVWREPSPDGLMYCFEVPTGFLVLRRNGCIFATGNTGKTMSALWAADYLMSISAGHSALIASPLSTLERVWGDAIFINFTHRKFKVLHGSADKRKKLLAQPADFYIINHDGMGVIEKELALRPDIDIVIIDELAVYRNKTTGKWGVMHDFIYPNKLPPKPYVWGLTGAPIPNEPTDAYAQCRLVTPHSVPQFFGQFRSLVMDHQSNFIWTARPESTKIVYAAMQPAIRFSRDECLDLPPEIHTTLDVEMSAEQKKHYKAVMKELSTEIQGGKITAMNEGIKLSKLLQIACGCAYDSDGVPRVIDAGNRIETLMELIECVNEKVIIYVPFTAVTGMLSQKLNEHWNFAVVTGDTPVKERNEVFREFQDPTSKIDLIAHPGCMSHGLTLTEASTIIWYAPIDSNDTYTQANGRITRAGQKYTANIVNLAGSPVERKMYKRLEERRSAQGLLLEMVERGEAL